MEVQDRISVQEEFIARLWQAGYFNSIPLLTSGGIPVVVLSLGRKNMDSGPDFKHIAVKINGVIHQGDMEIHLAANDWYQHGHHLDSAYNNVVLHLVIGRKSERPAIRHNQQPVFAEVYVEISQEEIDRLRKRYLEEDTIIPCRYLSLTDSDRIHLVENAGRIRFSNKAACFLEEREQSSWNQIIYKGLMEALGYSKNQRPFRRLSQLLPYEAVIRELRRSPAPGLIEVQALLFGVAGLLPSQDPRLLLKDADARAYIDEIEGVWEKIRMTIGIQSMSKEMWQFFRLRPNNFPTRRLAGASLLLSRFVTKGLLERLTGLCGEHRNNTTELIKSLEALFLCESRDFWKTHFRFEDHKQEAKKVPLLIGRDRSREIVVNIILPSLYGYSKEEGNVELKKIIIDVAMQYPKTSSNRTIKYMVDHLGLRSVSTSMQQQGLIHLHKSYCRKLECDRCEEGMR
ncbi:MAG: DUF2851 family protein [candidate division KSB1 bacterium]|jgi:hypothetical protein|nr:DUF2851 family protein [candidate division KSB1 bacterium]